MTTELFRSEDEPGTQAAVEEYVLAFGTSAGRFDAFMLGLSRIPDDHVPSEFALDLLDQLVTLVGRDPDDLMEGFLDAMKGARV